MFKALFLASFLVSANLLSAQNESAWESKGETIKFLGGAGEIYIPKGLKVMPEKVINVKYSGSKKPKEVYSDAYGYVSLAIKPTGQKLSESSLQMYLDQLVKAYGGMYGDRTGWKIKEVKTINGSDIAVMAYTEPEEYGGSYNLIFVGVVQREAVEFFFNCTGELLPKWEPQATQILESIKINWK